VVLLFLVYVQTPHAEVIITCHREILFKRVRMTAPNDKKDEQMFNYIEELLNDTSSDEMVVLFPLCVSVFELLL
jgi:hypothetical protein